MVSGFSLLGALGLTGLALAKTINVDVGEGGFVFSPDTITADVGDFIAFDVYPPHSVVQGDGFNNPCAFKPGGFFSGFSSSKQTFTVKVTDTNPIWLYCSVPTHCQGGMVAVINPGAKTLSDYKAAAALTSKSTDPGAKTGGESPSSSSPPATSSSSSESESTVETTAATTEVTETTTAPPETTETTEAVTTTTSQNGNVSVTTSPSVSPPIQTAGASSTVMVGVFSGLMAIVAGWAALI